MDGVSPADGADRRQLESVAGPSDFPLHENDCPLSVTMHMDYEWYMYTLQRDINMYFINDSLGDYNHMG